GLPVDLRDHRRAAARGLRPLDPLRRARHRRQPARGCPLRDGPHAERGMNGRVPAVLAAVLLFALVAATTGLTGLIYLPYWLLAAVPGLPLGWRLFGRHPLGWTAGAGLGYATTSLGIW